MAKQFLITRNVPCKDFEAGVQSDEMVEDDWLSMGGQREPLKPGEKEEEIPEIEVTKKQEKPQPIMDQGDDEDIPDMEEFAEENNLVEPDPATVPTTEKDDTIVKQRRYDLTITYDKYYTTPKVWLFGYDENRQPLKSEQIFDDISQDHARKTVTFDTHPHLGVPCAFIHPCKHASVMKKMIQNMIDNGKQPRVDQYLFLFLKFLSAVIPNIEYDYTIEIDAEVQ